MVEMGYRKHRSKTKRRRVSVMEKRKDVDNSLFCDNHADQVHGTREIGENVAK